MQIHVVLALTTGAMLHETRATSFDLDTALSFLLDVFDVSTSMANNLSTKIKTWNRNKINWDFLFRPFFLYSCQQS